MGEYNPHKPNVYGQEWVPIRDEDIEINHLIDEVEYGHSFTTITSRTLNDGRFYVNGMESNVATVDYKLAIYPRGMESESGPIRSVLIPVETVAVTGGCTAQGSPPSGAQALLTPAITWYYNFLSNNTTGQFSVMWLTFNTSATTNSNLLTGKRILGVNLLLGASIDWNIQANGPLVGMTDSATVFGGTHRRQEFNCPTGSFTTPTSRFKFGEFPTFTSASLVTGEVLPWVYADLLAMDGGGTIKVEIATGTNINSAPNGGSMQVWYAALEVVYCEEQRIAIGGWGFGPSNIGQNFINWGANVAPMRAWQARTASPVLPAGDYTMTISSYDLGDLWAPAQISPLELNACRQLYPMPIQQGVQVNLPFPFENNIGETFTAEESDVLPQLSLHTTTAVITEPHVYGRQSASQVWGTFTPSQTIANGFGSAGSYPWARFYARRFGNTTIPLRLFGFGGATGSGSIAPADFDNLPEIVDGWKEITLRLDTPATLGNTFSSGYRWSATNEGDGSRWEVLQASAPAISGLPASLVGQAFQQLYDATYPAPSGSAFIAAWYPNGVTDRYITTVTNDSASDAVLMFAADPPTVTGFTGSVQVQPVIGVGLNCGIAPCGVATGVFYNRLTWPLPLNTGRAADTFQRTVAAGGWGSNDMGQAYTVVGAATDFSVSPTAGGSIVPTNGSADRFAVTTVGGPDVDITALINVTTLPATGTYYFGLTGRYTDANNNYVARVGYTATTTTLGLHQRVAGVATSLAVINCPDLGSTSTGNRYLRFQVDGPWLRAKVWAETQEEPDWMVVFFQFTGGLTTGNLAGAYSRNEGSLGSGTQYVSMVTKAPDYNLGYKELQRMDAIDDWQTIMQATDTAVTGFNDYEARVGLQSSYRIRNVSNYGFYGLWSSTVNLTTTSPGATGGACLPRGHMLLFSSNMSQTGAYTLAYSSAWEDSQVSEEFSFPEASFVQLQPMYNKDFFTAFRPEERGGDRFQRGILVQAAAISPETLSDFTSMRDMAWAGIPYTCVRDEEGNRWFASVGVPNGKVVHDRTIYLATVDIAEVTDTPAPVDP